MLGVVYTLVLIFQTCGYNGNSVAMTTVPNIQTKEACNAFGAAFTKITPGRVNEATNVTSFMCVPTVSK